MRGCRFLSAFASKPLNTKGLLGLRRLPDLARPAPWQGRDAPVRGPRRPLPIRVATEHPALQGGLLKLAGFAFVERLLAQFAVRALPLEWRIAERPVQTMIGDQTV